MATNVSKTYVRRRKGMREERDEDAVDFEVIRSCKGERENEFIVEDESARRLELDVAETLAEFWRTAHEQAQRGKVDVCLRWSRKRTRSSLVIKDSNPACNPKEETEDAFSSAKENRMSCAFRRGPSLSDRDEIDSSRMSKEYSHIESRAQSPSSPLPSLQLPCGTFLSHGRAGAKSAFQRVLPLVPVQRTCLFPVKSEIEDMPSEVLTGRPEKVHVQRKTKLCKSRMATGAVKTERIMDDRKEAIIPEELMVKSEANAVSSLSVFTKPKSALSDKEKEARRLRRVQANRESARQTIRKKQAVCQDLMKNASRLTLENEGLRQKRESLLQDLFSLRGQNFYLKHQLEARASVKSGLVTADESPLPAISESVSVSSYLEGVLPSYKESYGVSVQRQDVSNVFNDDVCPPSSMERHLKEISSSIQACTQSLTPQCEGHSLTTAITDPDLANDQAEKSACHTLGHGDPVVSQPPPCVPCSTQTGLNTAPAGVVVAYESMDPFRNLQIAQGVRGGYGNDGSRSGFFVGSHCQTDALMVRNYFSAIAAAEARKKRKELTRHKFLRCRRLRPKVIVTDKTKEP